jgi:Flagellin and related hook-associated proteins
MRINTNVSALNTLRNLANSEQQVSSATAKLSSGFRINKASDDAAGLAIANKLRNTGRALSAAQKNVEQGTAMLQIADGSLQSISTILDRMKELATQYNSANTGTDAQANIQAEFDVLSTEIDRIVATTQYEGSDLLGQSMDFRIDDTGTADDLVTADLSSVSIDSSGLDVTDPTTIDTLLDDVNTAIGTVGAAESQLDFASKNLASKIENTAAAESTIRDADMAAEMTNYTKANIVAQAGMAILAQANTNAQSVLQLIRNG